MTKDQADLVAGAVVNMLLHNGLAQSTWRETHPDAYMDLLTYKADMVADAAKLLQRLKIV